MGEWSGTMNLLERGNQMPEEAEEQNKEQGTKTQTYTQEPYGQDNGQEPDRKPLTVILMGIIMLLLLCIVVILLVWPIRRTPSVADSNEALQQNIEDYATQQKQNDQIAELPSQDAIVVEPSEIPGVSENDAESGNDAPETTVIGSDAIDKTAIIVDYEDENDISYTKEFILNEMLPYFADNNLPAVWDLAHLKRYVKLSAGLKGTDTYYYRGDVDANGAPHGNGLAIYEDNTYYYGSWSHGVRSGDGRWYRFYIDEIGKPTTKKMYQAHSYSGQWSNDLPNGEGAEHYDVDISQIGYQERVILNVVGNFTDGLYDGKMYANTVDEFGNVEEWNAVARQGVFDLWRDMSSKGECSVWQHRDDAELCLDIDKSENKNQGMRELLRITTEK